MATCEQFIYISSQVQCNMALKAKKVCNRFVDKGYTGSSNKVDSDLIIIICTFLCSRVFFDMTGFKLLISL